MNLVSRNFFKKCGNKEMMKGKGERIKVVER